MEFHPIPPGKDPFQVGRSNCVGIDLARSLLPHLLRSEVLVPVDGPDGQGIERMSHRIQHLPPVSLGGLGRPSQRGLHASAIQIDTGIGVVDPLRCRLELRNPVVEIHHRGGLVALGFKGPDQLVPGGQDPLDPGPIRILVVPHRLLVAG